MVHLSSSRLNTSRPVLSGKNGEHVFTVTGVMFMLCNNCLMDDLFATCIAFPQQKALLQREYKNGVYGLKAWFSAFWLARLASQLLFAMCLLVPVYFIVGLRIDDAGAHVFVAAAALVLCSMSGTTLGIAIGAMSTSIDGVIGSIWRH